MAAVYSLSDQVQLEYVAEGAANVVYRPTLPNLEADFRRDGTKTPPAQTDLHSLPSALSRSTPPPTEIDIPSEAAEPHMLTASELQGNLLRIKKAVPWIPSYEALYEAQTTLINPHFPPDFLVPQTLVKLPPNLVTQLNEELEAAELVNKKSYDHKTGRASKRHGLYLATDESHCLLVKDMTADPDKGETLIEVKAKWLAQSPNAPKDSQRCRTCALRAMRRAAAQAKDAKANVEAAEKSFCPLDLGSADPIAVDRAVEAILTAKFGHEAVSGSDKTMQKLRNALLGFFLGTPIFPRLRELQQQLDPAGILSLSKDTTPSNDFLVATTLRDCTLFVRATEAVEHPGEAREFMTIEGKLGDLDLKAPEPGKIEYWRGLERDLIDGGWYQGKNAEHENDWCFLERMQ